MIGHAEPLAWRFRRLHGILIQGDTPLRTGSPKATKQIHFYAMKEDLLPVLEALESDGGMKYVLTGQFAEPSLLLVFDHGKDIPNLGEATSAAGISSDAFLVCEPELQIVPR